MRYWVFLCLLCGSLAAAEAQPRNPFAPAVQGPFLAGIVHGGFEPLVILAWSDGEQVALAVGETHRGASVREIGLDGVLLDVAGEERELAVGDAP